MGEVLHRWPSHDLVTASYHATTSLTQGLGFTQRRTEDTSDLQLFWCNRPSPGPCSKPGTAQMEAHLLLWDPSRGGLDQRLVLSILERGHVGEQGRWWPEAAPCPPGNQGEGCCVVQSVSCCSSASKASWASWLSFSFLGSHVELLGEASAKRLI